MAFMGAAHRYDAGGTLQVMHAIKLTTPQLAVLELTNSPRTVSEVAACIGLSLPATSQMVDKLVRLGLARRYDSSADRRARNVIVTAKGAGLVRRIADARAARFDAALATLPTSLAQRFARILGEVVVSLDAPRQEALQRKHQPRRGAT